MNQHNRLFHALKAMAPVERSACSNHRRDSEGFPLGNCIECTSYRKQMDAWYMQKVMEGIHQPEYDDGLDHDQMHDETHNRSVRGT